jgi:surface antigen
MGKIKIQTGEGQGPDDGTGERDADQGKRQLLRRRRPLRILLSARLLGRVLSSPIDSKGISMPHRPVLWGALVLLTLAACQSEPDVPKVTAPAPTAPAVASSAALDRADKTVRPRSKRKGAPVGPTGQLYDAFMVEGAPALAAEDRNEELRAEKRAATAQIGQIVTWQNPKTGHKGSLVAARDYYAPDGAYCRTFQMTLAVDATKRQASAEACQKPDQTWSLVR